MQQLRPRQLILAAVFLTSVIGLYILLTSSYTPVRIFQPTPQDSSSEFYQWRTNTSFSLPEEFDVVHAPLREICRHFPKHKLETIQPVLKTGHGSLERLGPSLHSTSACLDNLLILSDLEEEFEGHRVEDIIAEIPNELRIQDEAWQQFEAYSEMHRLQANGTLNDATFSRKQGWAVDKFKFIPALNRAWRYAPEKEWYVFYEGDTYIVWDTVFRLLENFDPNQPHYFGSPAPGGEGIFFAYGGSGYILSRAAMWRVVKADWGWNGKWRGSIKLLEEFWELLLRDCCGDSVLGWALHKHRIHMEGLWPMFNPHALHGLPFSDLYWCQPVIGMHKSSFTDEVDFWRWEWTARTVNPHRPVLFRDVATSFFNIASFTDVREGWDNSEWDAYDPAEDTPNDPHASSESCGNACEGAPDCYQWTYHLRRCKFVKAIRVGRAREPEVEKKFENGTWTEDEKKYVAGWRTAKIQHWMDDRPCDQVQWVKPSTQRIF